MTIKAPKEPKKPREPYPPNKPNRLLINETKTLDVPIHSSKYVSVLFSEIANLRSKINAPDDYIYLKIDSSTDPGCSCCDSPSSEIDRVYFEWYLQDEDPEYEKKLEKYEKEMEKYREDKASYTQKLEQYEKDIKEHKKKLKEYRLLQMKQEKENLEKRRLKLEADIAKAEKK